MLPDLGISLIGFVLILMPVVVIHEFGHFFFARLFGVKAEIFSVGFGPVIWSIQKGETNYRISWVPLGGYVKLMGEDPSAELSEEEKKRALNHQDPWKRFLIYFGGPLFNFIYAVFVFMVIFAWGEPQVGNVIGRVLPDTKAEQAGFMSGDEVVAINGTEIDRYEEIDLMIRDYPDKPMEFALKAFGQESVRKITVNPDSVPGFSEYGEPKPVGEIPGLEPFPRDIRVGISDPQSAAAKAGLKGQDKIIKFNGVDVTRWEQMERIYRSLPVGHEVDIEVLKSDGNTTLELTLTKGEGHHYLEDDWGLHSTELFIEKVIDDSPAAKAGLKKGDRLIKVDGNRLRSWMALRGEIQDAGKNDGTAVLTWERDGQIFEKETTLDKHTKEHVVLGEQTRYTVGLLPDLYYADPIKTISDRELNPFKLFAKGLDKTWELTYKNVTLVGKLIVGDASIKTLGGPIMIGKLAGDSLERGPVTFLFMMAILSVGLGVLNIMPIPVLDGGHILLLGIEVIRRQPLSLKQMEVLQAIGLTAILMLMAVVFFNDAAQILEF